MLNQGQGEITHQLLSGAKETHLGEIKFLTNQISIGLREIKPNLKTPSPPYIFCQLPQFSWVESIQPQGVVSLQVDLHITNHFSIAHVSFPLCSFESIFKSDIASVHGQSPSVSNKRKRIIYVCLCNQKMICYYHYFSP